MENRYIVNYDIKQRCITNVKFKQGDVDSSVLEVHLKDNCTAIDLTGETIEFRFLKPDDTICFQDSTAGVTITDAVNGVVECVLKSNTLAVPGTVKCDIHRSKDGKELTVPSFNFTVEKSIDGSGVASTNYISALDNYETTITNINSQLADIASELYNIYGVFWNKGSSPVLTRTDCARGATVNVGVDNVPVYNEFDTTPLFKDFQEVTDSYGNVFIRIPKMYIKKTDGASFHLVQISRKPFDGAYLPWCFWDFTNSKELDYIDVGKYKATLSDDGTKLESKSGKYPLINKTIVDFRNYAKANGAGYQQLDIHVWDLLQTLFTIEFATLNSQSICAGYSNGQWATTHLALISETGTSRIVVSNVNGALYAVGQAISVGTTQGGNQRFYGRTITAINTDTPSAGQTSIVFDGDPVNITANDMLYNTGWKNGFSSGIAASVGSPASNTDGKHPFVWHGIESLFGDIWQFCDGVNITDMQAWVCKNADNYASNIFANPYEQLGYANSNTDGYVSAMGFDANHPFAELPVAVAGSASTYYSDYCWHATGQRIARVGAFWSYGSYVGLFLWGLSNASSDAGVGVGGRLLRKPL